MFLWRKLFGGGEDGGVNCAITENGTPEEVNCGSEMAVEEEPAEALSPERMEGTITLLDKCLGMGVIDKRYKFYKDCVKSQNLRRNMRVSFIPVRKEGSIDIIAEDIVIIKSEKTKLLEERARHRVVNYKVIKMEPGHVLAGRDEEDDDPIMIASAFLPQGYPVMQGDWLKIELEAFQREDGEMDVGRAKVLSVDWIEKSNISGKVTKRHGVFCVDDAVFFTQSVVRDGRKLSFGDNVSAIAIASDQETRSNFRPPTEDFKKHYLFRKRALEVIYKEPVCQPENMTADEENDWMESGNHRDLKIQSILDNKDRIVVRPHGNVHFGSIPIGSFKVESVTIHNNQGQPVILQSVKAYNVQDVCEFQFEDGSSDGIEGRVIMPRVPFTLNIRCITKQLGRTRDLCVFDFGTSGAIGRWLTVTVSSEDEEWLKRTGKSDGVHWQSKHAKSREGLSQIIEDRKRKIDPAPAAVRPAFFIPNRIDSYGIPSFLYDIFRKEDVTALQKRFPIDFTNLTAENYVTRFQVSLWLEELENQVLRSRYNLQDVTFESAGELFMFRVPSLKEIIPAVLPGEQIECVLQPPSKERFKGTIEKIHVPDIGDPEIYVKFSEKFLRDYRYTPVARIRFCLGRNTYRKQHFAVIQAMKYLTRDWLFPQATPIKRQRVNFFEIPGESMRPHPAAYAPKPGKKSLLFRESRLKDGGGGDLRAQSVKVPFDSNVQLPYELNEFKLQWFNTALNKEQQDAVRGILKAEGRPLPYIIFGPPGTGKTITVVEAVMQTYFLEPTSRILVTVPSNAGADLISERLAATSLFRPGDFVRLNGFMRCEEAIPDTIVDFCVDGTYLESVAKHRLIICTVATAGQFFQLNLNTGHFSHVFVDEAGYCTEPETLMPCVLAAVDKEAVIVLAGDPEQLGPVLMNDMTINEVLKVPLLERLMNLKIYQRNEMKFPTTKYNPALLTKLVRSYRAHPTLLNVSSELFYQNELTSHAGQEAYEFCGKETPFLLNTAIPLVFHGVQGECERDLDSPSWYNLAEVAQIVSYVRQFKNYGISYDDIGIITPYRKQVQKVRMALQCRLMEMDGNVPKVASVQEFQGGERKVIIISTVRSDYEDVLTQKISRLDFLYSRKLFNVAITRAKALMIIIGNPYVLCLNKYWKRLLQYCVNLRVYTGCDLPVQLNHRLHDAVDKIEDSVPPLVAPTDDDDEDCDFPDGEDQYPFKETEY